jgi:hypothetical protein
MMTNPCNAADLGEAALRIFDRADLDHLRASVSGRLESVTFRISPEAAATVRAAAQVSGGFQGQVASVGIAIAAEMLCRREGEAFASVFARRQAENLKSLGGPSCPAPEKT